MSEGADWVEQARRLAAGLGETAGRAGDDGVGSAHSDCRWCPVCQVVALVRGERPEMAAALADVLTAAAGALRTFAESTPEPAPNPEPASAPTAPEEPVGADPTPPVQRIEIA